MATKSQKPELIWPYWSQGKLDPTLIESEPYIGKFQWDYHLDQIGDACVRPDCHAIYSFLIERDLLCRCIGLQTLHYFSAQYDEEVLGDYYDILLVGWIDVIKGPYADRLFAPTLLRGSLSWLDLNSPFGCLDQITLRSV